MNPDQLVIFSEPRARHNDSDTAFDAAKAASRRASLLEQNILDAYRVYGPMNDDELCGRLGNWYAPTVKSCRSRLNRRGLLMPSDVRRPSLRGVDSVVWQIPEQENDG